MKKLFIWMLLPLVTWGCGGKGTPDPTPDPDPDPVVVTESVSGSFLQHWYAKGWTESRWNQEMDVLKDAGMAYLIYSPVKEDDEDPDYASLEKCLKTAASHGIKVFVGDQNFYASKAAEGYEDAVSQACEAIERQMKKG